VRGGATLSTRMTSLLFRSVSRTLNCLVHWERSGVSEAREAESKHPDTLYFAMLP